MSTGRKMGYYYAKPLGDEKMLDLEQIKKRLADENLSEVAGSINCTRAYVSHIATGRKKNPSYKMVKRLSDYLIKKQGA